MCKNMIVSCMFICARIAFVHTGDLASMSVVIILYICKCNGVCVYV